MLQSIAQRLFGSANDREVKRLQGIVNEINSMEADIEKLTDEQLKARTENFRREYTDGKTLDELIVDTFATVREAAKRTLGQRHYDVQLLGGMVLHQGKIYF